MSMLSSKLITRTNFYRSREYTSSIFHKSHQSSINFDLFYSNTNNYNYITINNNSSINYISYRLYHNTLYNYNNRYSKIKNKNDKSKNNNTNNINTPTTNTNTTNPHTNTHKNRLNILKNKIANDNAKFQIPDKDKEKQISLMQNEINHYYTNGNYNDALKLSKELLIVCEIHYGKYNNNHPVLATSYNNLGLFYKLLGNYNLSRNNYNLALNIYKNSVGIDHSSYASVLNNLGNLNRNQIHIDTTLNITDRLSLIDTSINYLQEAYNIYKNELGINHAKTISSKSSLGITLATKILHYYKMITTTKNEVGGDLMKKKFYLSLLSDTNKSLIAWKAAEEHLREALNIAITNPRGKSILNNDNDNNNKTKQSNNKLSIKPEEENVEVILKDKDSKDNENKDININKEIVTLSAAHAAQNLAIFLKCRATTIIEEEKNTTTIVDDNTITITTTTATASNDDNNDKAIENNSENDLDSNDNNKDILLNEAYKLYQQIINVQNLLLPKQHPDIYTTKYSYAELLECMGDEEAANIVRTDILDTYDPPKSDSDSSSDTSEETTNDEENEDKVDTDSNNPIAPTDDFSTINTKR